ncbi:MAG: restriction endonuclease subunit S, partial [Dolichospermum sp.]
SSLDDKIELNNRINSELENLAKTIYDYWFVQFDFPDENGTPYKSSGGKMVYNQERKREIPAGWEVKKLRQFASTASGGTPLSTKKEYYENGSIAWINSGELNNRYITEAKNFITQSGLNNSSAKLFEPNTLLIAMYGATAGKVSLLQINACTNQAICAIIPNSDIHTKFLKFATDDLYNFLINLSTGSARDNLSQDLIRELSFALPQENLLIKFNQMVNPMITKILNNHLQNQQLTQLRDWLLPMLMNGQITVK